ncbi:hypothetical protein [Jutongia hominis]|uniref:Uncharacterized protein n=1 Tax=Jutongia hominis TaxID=2763664 RepID=A0ABR7MSV5_9FIRM|nr:hypothetical protein [Jutongia hominis]MBC8556749.1 hypothetical protein [Jutongia hominis]
MLNIREIETIIDIEHKKSPVFDAGKEQTFYDLLAAFEDVCGLILMGSMFNPLALKKITDQMDALNISLLWVDEICVEDMQPLDVALTETRYKQCCELLNDYAYPYSVICSGYISYSRNRYAVDIEDNKVIFTPGKEQNKSMWSDVLRESSQVDLNDMASIIDPYRLITSVRELRDKVKVENGMICYELSSDMLNSFKKVALQQWELSKTLPENWVFDSFTMEEYKAFWVALTTLCYVHFCSCFAVGDPLVRLKNSNIIQNSEYIVAYIISASGLEKEKVETIIQYITFEPKKKNVDIMYQPIVKLSNGTLIITPILFMGSRPERNLLAVVSSRRDSNYFKEVNDLEKLMVSELETYVSSPDIIKHKHLREDLPDIDFAIFDRMTNSAIICETKWFAAADSTKEVYAKEDEITHGCKQIEEIMAYAMQDRKHFVKQVFNVEDGETVDIFVCVVAKHNIRTHNKYVPVIDLKRMEELLSKYSLSTVFHMIRNHQYEIPLPEGASITYQRVFYAGFEFRIPAICFKETFDQV